MRQDRREIKSLHKRVLRHHGSKYTRYMFGFENLIAKRFRCLLVAEEWDIVAWRSGAWDRYTKRRHCFEAEKR
jgi:hypothetical protein